MKRGKMRERTKKILFLLSFILLFFAARLHYYRSPLTGEEGMFADLVVNGHQGPDFLLTSRVDGENKYFMPRHPNGLYHVTRAAGSLFSPLIDRVPWQDDAKITPAVRFVFSTSMFFILSVLVVHICTHKKPINPLLIILFMAVAISPVAIFTSANLQLDGSVGVLMNGVFALGLLFFLSSNSKKPIKYILLFASSFFLATGKQEWSMILLAAIFVVALYLAFIRSGNSAKISQDVFMLLTVTGGLVAGNIFSYFIGPYNYVGGFEVFWNFSRVSDVVKGEVESGRWIRLTLARLEWTDTIIALIAISGISVFIKRKEIKLVEILLWVYGLGLFAGYSISIWNSEPRYFAPSLVVMTAAIIAVFPPKISAKSIVIIASIILLMFATTAKFLHKTITELPSRPYFDASQIKLQPDQIAILSTANAWNKPDIDFINNSNTKERIERTAKKLNKKLYPEDYVWPGYSIKKKSPE